MNALKPPPSPWKWYDRLGLLFLGVVIGVVLPVFALFLAWNTFVSVAYLQPVRYDVEKIDGVWIARFERYTPRGPVYAEWTDELVVEGTGRECRDAGSSTYQPIAGDETIGRIANVATYEVSPVIVPCLEASRPVHVYQTWTVYLAGLVPLRSVSMTTVLD